MLSDYNTGQYSLSMLSQRYGYSAAAIYYKLKKVGCVFSRKWKKEMSPEARERLSRANKGKVLSPEQRRMISERNSCNYNGLNGYGHTKLHQKGYIIAYVPKHPHANKDGYVMYHTIVMERAIGRYLNEDEVVHHINHDRADNRLENLQLMNKHEHMSMHMKERHQKRRNALLTA